MGGRGFFVGEEELGGDENVENVDVGCFCWGYLFLEQKVMIVLPFFWLQRIFSNCTRKREREREIDRQRIVGTSYEHLD